MSTAAGVDVALRDTPAQALLADTDLTRHRAHSGRHDRVLASVLQHQTHRSSLQHGTDQLGHVLTLLDSTLDSLRDATANVKSNCQDVGIGDLRRADRWLTPGPFDVVALLERRQIMLHSGWKREPSTDLPEVLNWEWNPSA